MQQYGYKVKKPLYTLTSLLLFYWAPTSELLIFNPKVIASLETLHLLFPQSEMLISHVYSWLAPSHHLNPYSNFNS